MRSRTLCTFVVAAAAAVAVMVPAAATGRAAANPPTHYCGHVFIVIWKHGSANFVRVHGMTCARAKTVIAYALDHGLVKPSPRYRDGAWVQAHGYFVQKHRRVLGFTFTYQHPNLESHFVARKGGALLTFSLCWNEVNC
jgi:hypothetical protein